MPEAVPACDVFYDLDELWPAESLDRARGLGR